MAKKIFFISILFALNYSSFSQVKLCSEYEADKKAELENPDALNAKQQLEIFTKQFIQNNTKTETTYIIPVVFHVLHDYGSENISKEQILDAVRILNEDFYKLNADTSDIIPEFQGIAANCHIQFRLAKLDPNGNCTDGIVRVVTSETHNANDNTKQLSASWDRTKYLNIWTAANLESGAAGYSYYPSSVSGSWGVNVDGVIILANYVGSIGSGNYTAARALTHEIGHYINLAHPWGNSNQPGLLSNCDIDDGVDDTPNTIGHTNCILYAESCGSLDNVQNYMEYAYCDRMFTNGQKVRMQAALNSGISGRNNLWSTSNLIATGTNDGYIAQACVPIADFSYNKAYGCDNLIVQYNNLTWNIDSSFSLSWSFPGGLPSGSTDINPVVSYLLAGTYSATLVASNISGSSQVSKSNIIQIQNSSLGEDIPWVESFENNNFPLNLSDSTKNWLISGNSNNNWNQINVAYDGQYSETVPISNNDSGQISELYSPNIVFAGNNPNSIFTFRVAYAQKTVNDNDKLQVYVSYNCGQTWYPRYSRSGTTLSTNSGALVNSFIPDTSQWRKETIGLGIFMSHPSIRVKFLVTSGNGNNIYIDDINLNQLTNVENLSLAETSNLNVYPNPINKESVIVFDLNENANVKFQLTDILGQVVSNNVKNYSIGIYDLYLNDLFKVNLQSGVYFLKVVINNKSQTLKLIKD